MLKLLILLSALNALGEHQTEVPRKSVEPDTCNILSLTKNCTMLSPDGPDKIMFGDGTFIPNWAAINKPPNSLNTEKTESEKNKKVAAIQKKLISNIKMILDKAYGLDEEFKMHLIQEIQTSPDILLFILKSLGRYEDKEGRIPSDSETLLWPTQGNNKTEKEVTAKEIEASNLKNISAENALLLQNLVKEIEDSKKSLKIPENKVVRELSEFTEKRRSRVLELVDFAKNSLIHAITQGRPLDKLSREEKIMIDRFKTVSVTPFEKIDSPLCEPTSPNAFYDITTHSINICPNMLNYPDSTVVGVIGHEFSHANDPCSSKFGLHAIYPEVLVKLQDVKSEIAGDPSKSDFYNNLLQTAVDHVDATFVVTSTPFHLSFGAGKSKETYDYFVKKGVIKQLHPEIPRQQYPLDTAYNCLQTKRGGGFRGINKTEVKTVVKNYTNRNRELFGKKAKGHRLQETELLNIFSQYPDCFAILKESQMSEVIADLGGSKVLGDFVKEELKKGKFKTEEEKLAPFSHLADTFCAEYHQEKNKTKGTPAFVKAQEAITEFTRGLDSHPFDRRRVDDIFLKNPDIRKAMGCSELGTAPCTYKTETL